MTTALPRNNLRMGPTEYGLVALQSMLWGSSFFFIALVRDALPPMTLSALRLAPAALLLLVIVISVGQRLPRHAHVWAKLLLFCLVANVIPFLLIIIAQREVSGGVAAVFNATTPLFAVFLASWFIPDEPLLWRRVAGILVGVLGVAVLIGVNPDGTGSLMAKACLLSAACCYAASNVFARRYLGGIATFALACSQMVGAFAMALLLALIFEQPWTLPTPATRTLIEVFAMGTIGSALASLCHFTVLRRAGATNAGIVTIILPLTPIALGGYFLGERLSWQEWLGASIIALGLVIIDGRPLAWLQRRLGMGETR